MSVPDERIKDPTEVLPLETQTFNMVYVGVLLTLILPLPGLLAVNWLEWWTYDGISGPSFWGLINPEWSLCNQGLR